MNGIDPPMPQYCGGLPQAALDAASNALRSHGAGVGANHPVPAFSSSNDTLAPYGWANTKTKV